MRRRRFKRGPRRRRSRRKRVIIRRHPHGLHPTKVDYRPCIIGAIIGLLFVLFAPYLEPITEPAGSYIKSINILDPERKDDCKGAFDYVNEIRAENGREPIKWDDRLYALAVFKAKDMYERDYFDHVDPDGNCIGQYKSQFNITEQLPIAENLGGLGSHMYISENCYDVVNGWLESRGHRYNLLWPTHYYGAIGCYKHNCAFLGMGPGNWVCATSGEGLGYWATADEQPFEN